MRFAAACALVFAGVVMLALVAFVVGGLITVLT